MVTWGCLPAASTARLPGCTGSLPGLRQDAPEDMDQDKAEMGGQPLDIILALG